MPSIIRTLIFAFLLSPVASATETNEHSEADDLYFRKQVAPLLDSCCLSCHSHASGVMEGGLTLDSASGWKTGGNSGPAVVAGNPEESLLIRAVHYNNPDLQMPPDEKLPDEAVRILEEWVRRGAPDPRLPPKKSSDPLDWWSLRPLRSPPVPGDGHPIDAFVQARLQGESLDPSPVADRRTLARRLYSNLHGYLPLPQDVRDFVESDEPRAVEQLIDQLLSSPQYGERWARHWLDVAHFADSHGCEHDVKRPNAWRFRDYVIDRLNADISWGEFIREQLAADVFFPEQPQLKAGLGFVAAGPMELSRAGTAPLTFDYLDRDDMVTQTMSAFVSTTVHCARCHTHKFDPVTQEDYYALQAVFAGIGRGDIEFDGSAEVMHQRRELQELEEAVSRGDAAVLLQGRWTPIIQAWVAEREHHKARWQVLTPSVFVAAGGADLKRREDDAVLASGHVADQEVYTVTSPVNLRRLTAARLEVLSDQSLPEGGPGRAENGNLHLTEAEFHWFPAAAAEGIRLEVSRTSADYDQTGWDSSQSVDGNLTTGWAIHPRVGQSHQIVFEFHQPPAITDGGQLAVTLRQLHPPKHVIGCFRLAVTDAENGAARTISADVAAALRVPPDQQSKADRIAIAAAALRDYASTRQAALPPMHTAYGISASWSHAKKLPSPQAPKIVHLLRRGNIHQPIREAEPGAVSAMMHLPGRFHLPASASESARRAALADWIAHPDNPLTWRSVVNRVWHYHFGRGLCDTPNDFGRMGGLPSHPELLDWLAVWFRDEAGGSLKQLHRLILTSQTWQQSSQLPRPPQDSDNRLLSRMNRRRLDAETYRDSILRISGRLNLTRGGPGIEQFTKSKGPQATPALDYSSFNWNSPDATRRSIYRVVWRGIPDPFMEALDFPDLGLPAPRRDSSVSALQSLTMFNNDFVLTASRCLAEHLGHDNTPIDQQVEAAVRRVWLRSPRNEEQSQMVPYAQQYGMAALCRVLLNSNEFLFVD